MADNKRRAPAASREHLNATVTVIESHRIVALLSKAVERLELLARLNYDNYDAAGGPAGGEAKEGGGQPRDGGEGSGVGAILQNQKEMEQRYDELLTTTAKVKRNPLDPSLDLTCFLHINDEEQRKQQQELEKVSNNLKLYSKELKRQLKENPNDSNNWNKVVNGRTELTRMLLDVVRELQSTGAANGPRTKGGEEGTGYEERVSDHSESQRSGRSGAGGPSQASYEMFAVKVNDEQNEQIWADEIVKREKETNQNVKTLQNEVAVERHKKEQELEERQQQLSKLKKDVRALRNLRTEDYERLKGEREAQAEAQARRSRNRQRELREQIQNVEERIEIEKMQVSRELREHLDKKTKEVWDSIGKWNLKSQESTRREDEQLAYKNNEKNDLKIKLLEKKQELDEQEAKFKSNQVKQVRERERKERAEELERMRREASTRLQAAFHGFMVRKDLKDGKKGKKKKGKK